MGEASEPDVRDLLLPTHIYYESSSIPLRQRAFAEIITKILFLSKNKKARFSEIQKEMAATLDVKNINQEEIRGGLDFLLEARAIEKEETRQKKYYILAEKTYRHVSEQLTLAQNRISRILENYFPKGIGVTRLEKWFKKAGASFFAEYGESCAKALYRQISVNPHRNSLEKILVTTIDKEGLSEYKEALISGFYNFISNFQDDDVRAQIWSFSQAMLSSKLISAVIGPDPLTINEFKDSMILLDTNILIKASLEKSKIALALSSLVEGLKKINVTLGFIEKTKEEYRNTVTRKKEATLRAVRGNVPLELISEANDLFIKTALSRKCHDEESFETFFKTIDDPPTEIEGAEVKYLDSPEYEALIKAEQKKGDKKRQMIASEWKRFHQFEKSQNAVQHDEELDIIAHELKKGEKIWILTADISMQSFSEQFEAPSNPIWITFGTLIQLLAIYGAGPGHKPEDFAPLLSALIESDIQVNSKTFVVEDLDSILDIADMVRDIDVDKAKQVLCEASRLRLAGKPLKNEEIQLRMRRVFQRKSITSKEQEQKLQEEVLRTKGKVDIYASEFAKEYEPKVKFKIYFWFYLKVSVLLLIGLLPVIWGITQVIQKNEVWGGIVISLGGALLCSTLFWYGGAHQKAKSEIKEIVKNKLDELQKKGELPL